MITVNVYLTFNGNCREAFNFYKSVFGGDFPYVGTYGEMPPQPGMEIPDNMKDKIMHITLPIGGDTVIMGSDSGGAWASEVTPGNNFSLSVNTKDKDEALKIFDALSLGGKITMPLAETFWQSYFGMLTDKFGINWMVNCELASHKQFEEENK